MRSTPLGSHLMSRSLCHAALLPACFDKNKAVKILSAALLLFGWLALSPGGAFGQGPQLVLPSVNSSPAAGSSPTAWPQSVPSSVPALRIPEPEPAPSWSPSALVSPSVQPEAGFPAAIETLLREGRQLETQQQWSDALRHYESSMRQFPQEPVFKLRFRGAKMHHDVVRRYADSSYLNLLDAIGTSAALDTFDEVISNIRTYHVDAPTYHDLLVRGTEGLDIALSEPSFLQRYQVTADASQIQRLLGDVRGQLSRAPIRSMEDARSVVYQIGMLAEQQLKLPADAVIFEYVTSATSSLDAYSAYLTPNQLRDVYATIDGDFVGLGVEIETRDRQLRIVRVINGSPAARSGVLAGDRIVAIDGQYLSDIPTERATELLQGEVDSICRLQLLGENATAAREVVVRREHIAVSSIEDAKVDPTTGVGYMKLTCFQKTTDHDLDTALWKLHREGMKSLIIDLRGNPGGLLNTAVTIVDKFVGDGVIVSTHGRSASENFTYSAHDYGTWRVPLVVLIDKDSASAAEIFAGAIRDHGRGVVVGERSFGKGSVQGIFSLQTCSIHPNTLQAAHAGIRLTTAKFYSPKGRAYSGTGVEPDLLVHRVARRSEAGDAMTTASTEDYVLSAADEQARRLIQARYNGQQGGRPGRITERPR